VRPVAAPDEPLGCVPHQRARERRDRGIGIVLRGAAHRARQLHPHPAPVEHIEHGAERGLIDAVGRRHAGEVIEHDRIGQRQQRLGIVGDVVVVRIELHVPAVVGRALGYLRRQVRDMAAALRAHHAQAGDPEPREPRELGGTRVLRHQRDAAKAVGIALERVGQEAIVAAVAAGAHDHRSAQPEPLLQRDEGFRQRIARGVGTVGRERIFRFTGYLLYIFQQVIRSLQMQNEKRLQRVLEPGA
jgi:hypothetical protein